MALPFYEKLEQSLFERFVKKTGDLREIEKLFVDYKLEVTIGNRKYRPHFKHKTNHDWGTEYVFNIPLGMTFSDCLDFKDEISSALNKRVEMSFNSLLHINVFEIKLT